MQSSIRAVVAVTLTVIMAFAAQASDLREGAVYLMTNQDNNAVMAFYREPDGTLTFVGSFLTGGAGDPVPAPDSGDPPTDPLASQGSLVLSDDGRFLFAVNAGTTHSVTAFAVQKDGLKRIDTDPARDLRPISLTVHGNLLYLLADGSFTPVGRSAASIVGFRIGKFGSLTRLDDSDRIIASGMLTDPAQIGFSPDGRVLIVTDKLNSLIYSFPVRANGLTSAPIITASSGATPFGFAFDGRGHIFVSEAAGGGPGASTVSSYELMAGGALGSISTSVPDFQTAACWIVVTPNNRFVFTSNAGSGQVSSYRILDDGRIELLESTASRTLDTSGPIDLAVSRDGKRLYVHQAGRQAIAVFKLEVDGNLNRRPGITDLPFGAQGIAAY